MRTCWELAELGSIEQGASPRVACADQSEPHPIMPRMAPGASGVELLLPWDPDYVARGTGDATPLTYQPSWARGPSRFVMEAGAWIHVTPELT